MYKDTQKTSKIDVFVHTAIDKRNATIRVHTQKRGKVSFLQRRDKKERQKKGESEHPMCRKVPAIRTACLSQSHKRMKRGKLTLTQLIFRFVR